MEDAKIVSLREMKLKEDDIHSVMEATWTNSGQLGLLALMPKEKRRKYSQRRKV